MIFASLFSIVMLQKLSLQSFRQVLELRRRGQQRMEYASSWTIEQYCRRTQHHQLWSYEPQKTM